MYSGCTRAGFEQVRLPMPCPMRLGQLDKVSAKTYFCEGCNKHVHDLRKADFAEFEKLNKESGGSFCAIYDTRINFSSSLALSDESVRLSRFLSVFILAFGLSIFNPSLAETPQVIENVKAHLSVAHSSTPDSLATFRCVMWKSSSPIAYREVKVYINDQLYATHPIDSNGMFRMTMPKVDGTYRLSFAIAGYLPKEPFTRVRIKNGRPTKARHTVPFRYARLMMGFL